MYLELRENGIEQKGHVKLDAEVSCVDISPLADDAEAASLLAVGTWDMQVHVYSLPAMTCLVSEQIGGEVIPRSVLFAGELVFFFPSGMLGIQFVPALDCCAGQQLLNAMKLD